MKAHIEDRLRLDGIVEADELVNIEVQERPTGLVLYVCTSKNATIVRIGHIKPGNLTMVKEGSQNIDWKE